MITWTKRDVERIRLDIIKDLIILDQLTCKRISAQRHTRLLPESRLHRQAAANHETVKTITMKTDVVPS